MVETASQTAHWPVSYARRPVWTRAVARLINDCRHFSTYPVDELFSDLSSIEKGARWAICPVSRFTSKWIASGPTVNREELGS
jgi:hypothetical protein